MTTPATAEELRSAQEKEYGTYIATEAIRIDGALAFIPGHRVPISHVEQGLVSPDQVEKATGAKPKADRAPVSTTELKD